MFTPYCISMSKTFKTIISVRMKLFNLILVLFIIFYGIVMGQDDSIKVYSDYMEYDQVNKIIYAKDNVKISSGNFIISGNKMEYYIDKKYLVMTDSVTMYDGNLFFSGDKMDYDLFDSTGRIYRSFGYLAPFYFSAKELDRDKDIYNLRKARFSTCNLNPPHYVMKVSNAELIKKKDIMHVNNISFWVGKIPFFYLPYYPFSLKQRHDVWYIYPGYGYGGFTMKVIYGFPVSQSIYSKIYFDNLALLGIGLGAEINYNVKDNYKGTIYGYHIKENISPYIDRWNLRAGHWQKLSDKWTMQGNVEFQSDETFNVYYFGENWFPVNRQVSSNFGLTRQTNKTYLQLSAYTIYNSTPYIINNTTFNKFILNNYSAPRIDFSLLPVKLLSGLVSFGFGTTIGNNYERNRDYEVIESTTNASINREIKVTKNDTITPKLGLIEAFQSPSKYNKENIFLTKTLENLSYKHKFNDSVNINLIYTLTNRFVQNTFNNDINSDDYGIETNRLDITFMALPKEEISLRVYTGYDYRRLRNENVADWTEKIAPVMTDINITYKKLGLNFGHMQVIKPFAMQSLRGQIDYGDKINEKKYFSLGLFYTDPNSSYLSLYNQKTFINITNEFALWLNKKWHIKVSNYLNADSKEFNLQQQIMEIYRDLHCWEATLTYKVSYLRDTGAEPRKVEEYYLNLGLKVGNEAKKKLYQRDIEKEFYPWRTSD